jgi:hypothetical protein
MPRFPLQVVIFIGTVTSESTAPLLASAGVVPALFSLMGAKRSDDEMVLQLAYAFYKLLGYAATREQLLADTQVGGLSCAGLFAVLG